MVFRKKKAYEDIYKWRRSKNGTCFYCYEDKTVAIPLIGDKGICPECLKDFRIGHVATDRHLITHLTQSLRSHDETVLWLKKQGIKLAPTGQKDGVNYYMAINNPGIFTHYYDIVYGSADLNTVDKNTALKIMDCYTDIEIFQDGDIRITY